MMRVREGICLHFGQSDKLVVNSPSSIDLLYNHQWKKRRRSWKPYILIPKSKCRWKRSLIAWNRHQCQARLNQGSRSKGPPAWHSWALDSRPDHVSQKPLFVSVWKSANGCGKMRSLLLIARPQRWWEVSEWVQQQQVSDTKSERKREKRCWHIHTEKASIFYIKPHFTIVLYILGMRTIGMPE